MIVCVTVVNVPVRFPMVSEETVEEPGWLDEVWITLTESLFLMVPAVAVAVPPFMEYALPVLMLMGLAVLLFLKPVMTTAFEEIDEKIGTPNLLVKLKGLGLIDDPLKAGNQSTPQPPTIKASAIAQSILKSLFFISPVPDAGSAVKRV